MTKSTFKVPEGKPSIDEIDYRTKLANCEQLELKVKKDSIDLENKSGNLCRIDVALSEFDKFLTDTSNFIHNFADMTQSIVPSMTPKQYERLKKLIHDQQKILAERRLHLTLESTLEQTNAEKDRKTAQAVKAKKTK